jgi:hypothetical protein
MLRKPSELARDEPQTVRHERGLKKSTVQELLEAAAQKLFDANLKVVSEPTRFEAAYDSILFGALALFAAQGYRVSSKLGHHQIALEGLAAELKLNATLHEEI